MNIFEACKKAGVGGKIRRQSDLDPTFFLVPTNHHSGVSMFSDGQRISGMWDPKYSDLTATDWEVIEKGPFKGPFPRVIKENRYDN